MWLAYVYSIGNDMVGVMVHLLSKGVPLIYVGESGNKTRPRQYVNIIGKYRITLNSMIQATPRDVYI